MPASNHFDYDFIIIGSGFGGSVSALRLSEKGYKVLVVEKGKWYKPMDFAKTNWDIKRWLWIPALKTTGIMRLSIFQHLNILSGSGVGGGSLVYACTLPIPKSDFFKTGSWATLNDWESVLRPHYDTAYRMLGAQVNPKLCAGDEVLRDVAKQLGREQEFHPTKVAIFFAREGESAGQRVADPYFNGQGPERNSCIHCGACMTGCRHNAKNTLDKNYLYLAQNLGAVIQAESFVHDVRPLSVTGDQGYEVHIRPSTQWFGKTRTLRARGIVFAAGALGTNKLLLKLKQKSMPKLSERIGYDIRSNNETLITVATADTTRDFSQGIAIGSILHTDEHSHLEPCRYGAGSGAWRITHAPMAHGSNIFIRFGKIAYQWLRYPVINLKIAFIKDWARNSQVMLFMQHLDSTLRFKLNAFGFLQTQLGTGEPPRAYIPHSDELAKRYAQHINGRPYTMLVEQIFNTPSTAHILGGAVMGASAQEGVIDAQGRLFGYDNAYVCDGSMISANPGVNPSLSITAVSEYIMAQIKDKSSPTAQ